MIPRIKLSRFAFALGTLFFMQVITSTSCKKKDQYDTIPNVSVEIYLPLSLPEYSALTSVGNSIEITGGVKGIIVYRKSIDEFAAYERSCSFDPLTAGAIVDIDSSTVLGVDYHCGSKFLFLDGSVVNGPANRPLKAYHTEYDPTSLLLYIYN